MWAWTTLFRKEKLKVNHVCPTVGEVWMVELPQTDGREQSGFCPFVVVPNNKHNEFCPVIKGIPLSRYDDKKEKLGKSPVHVLISKTNNSFLNYDSIALCEQQTSTDVNRFKYCIGRICESDLEKISVAKMIDEPNWIMMAINAGVLTNPNFSKFLQYESVIAV